MYLIKELISLPNPYTNAIILIANVKFESNDNARRRCNVTLVITAHWDSLATYNCIDDESDYRITIQVTSNKGLKSTLIINLYINKHGVCNNIY